MASVIQVACNTEVWTKCCGTDKANDEVPAKRVTLKSDGSYCSGGGKTDLGLQEHLLRVQSTCRDVQPF